MAFEPCSHLYNWRKENLHWTIHVLGCYLIFLPIFHPPLQCLCSNIFQSVVYTLCLHSFSLSTTFSKHSGLASTPIILLAWLSLRSLGVSWEHIYYVGYSLLPDSHLRLHKHAHPWFFFNISGCSFDISVAHHFPFPMHLKFKFSMLNPKCSYFPLGSCLSQSNLWPCLQSLPMQMIHRAI